MIAQVAIAYEVNREFDYDASAFPQLQPGKRVAVDFRNRKIVGVVTALKDQPEHTGYQLKPVDAVLDTGAPAISSGMLAFARALQQRYLYSLGSIIEMMLPQSLRRPIEVCFREPEQPSSTVPPASPLFIREGMSDDVRFDEYVRLIREARGLGRGVIICVPNKEDIVPLRRRLTARMPDLRCTVLTGTGGAAQQYAAWLSVRRNEVDACIGTRQVLFAPFDAPAAVIIEREDAYAHFQTVKPFYHSRDVALLRGGVQGARVVFHADFPSLAVHRMTQEGTCGRMDLFRPATPRQRIFNLNDYSFKKYPVFSELTTELIRSYVETGRKVIVFWNRKGFGNIVRCDKCHHVMRCSHCDAPLRYEKESDRCICHTCLRSFPLPGACPGCKSEQLKILGVGLERIEQNLNRFFPAKAVKTLAAGTGPLGDDWDIIVSTQKVLDTAGMPRADLVIASGIDDVLSAGDYTGSWELFVLLQRLRQLARQEFVLFTLNPAYYPIAALNDGEDRFYKEEAGQRLTFQLPPYHHMALIGVRGAAEEKVASAAEALYDTGIRQQVPGIQMFRPIREYPYRKSGKYHLRIVVKAPEMETLTGFVEATLKGFRRSGVQVSHIIQ